MSTTEFAAAVISALAWPSLVLFLVALFRNRLATVLDEFILLIPNIKRLNVGRQGFDTEFFDKQMAVAEAALEPLDNAFETPTEADTSIEERVERGMLDTSPGAALLAVFARLEAALRELADAFGYSAAETAPLESIRLWLSGEAVLGASTSEAVFRLIRSRDEALLDLEHVDHARAKRHTALAHEVLKRVAIARREAPPRSSGGTSGN